MRFDHKAYFDSVRASLFAGGLTQRQVDGQEMILSEYEDHAHPDTDLRWLAYSLATTYHETAQQMWPIEEYGKGKGHDYGVPDAETGETYYGRGFVQLTWRDNYAKADRELKLSGNRSCEWHAENALDSEIATDIMFVGMRDGWFRPPNKLITYFNGLTNDPYGAREIINGDKTTIPDWSNGVSIGNLIAEYHYKFFNALHSAILKPLPVPTVTDVNINIDVKTGVMVSVSINGVVVYESS